MDKEKVGVSGADARPPAVQDRRNRLLFRLLPYLVLAVTLGCSLFVCRALDAGFQLKARTAYNEKTSGITSRIAGRLRDQEQVLLGGVGLFNAKQSVTRRDWRRYVEAQQLDLKLPGVLGMGYTAWLTPAQKDAIIRKIRSEGFRDFDVRPEGERAVYTSIIYLQPFNWRNQRAFGYDMYSEPVRRAAMAQAVNQGMTTIAGKIILVQETGKEVQNGILMYVPVYRQGMPTGSREERWAALEGFVYSPIRMNDFVFATVDDFPEDIAFDIYDGTVCTPEHCLFSSTQTRKTVLPPGYRAELASSVRVDAYGRIWTIAFKTLPNFSGHHNRGYSIAFLVGGVLVSILAAFFTASLVATRERALKMAGMMVLELQQSEEKVSLILNSTGEAIYGLDTSGRCTFCNDACLRILGYDTADDLLGKNMHDQIHHSRNDGSALPEEECNIFVAFHHDKGTHSDDEVLWKKDGTSFPAEYWSYPQRKDGKVVGAVVTFVDITERKRLEQELQLQAAQLEREVNQRQQAQEALAGHALKLEQLNASLEKMVESEVAKNREKDKKLIQQDKLASIGQLAAGVAHEINNPIGFISSNLGTLEEYCDNLRRHHLTLQQLISGHLPPELQQKAAQAGKELGIDEILEDLDDLIHESRQGALRVAKIVNDLKGFSRVDSPEYEEVDLSNCLESALSIAYNEIKYVATVTKEYAELPPVHCNPGQLNQVFMNLLVNAAHAIEGQGEITLRTWFDAGHVYASVSDTGTGMGPGILEHIFIPFFTTKGVGKGTGLGLSISYDIIKKHSGEITVESSVGAGSTFTVKLPRTDGKAAGAGDGVEPATRSAL